MPSQNPSDIRSHSVSVTQCSPIAEFRPQFKEALSRITLRAAEVANGEKITHPESFGTWFESD
jgi:hypothetical protein